MAVKSMPSISLTGSSAGVDKLANKIFVFSIFFVMGCAGNEPSTNSGFWQPLHRDREGETFVDVGSVIYVNGGQNRVTKIVKDFHQPDGEGFQSILWHVEFECRGMKRYRLTSSPIMFRGKMATGEFLITDYNEFNWQPVFNPFDEAQFFACAMTP